MADPSPQISIAAKSNLSRRRCDGVIALATINLDVIVHLRFRLALACTNGRRRICAPSAACRKRLLASATLSRTPRRRAVSVRSEKHQVTLREALAASGHIMHESGYLR